MAAAAVDIPYLSAYLTVPQTTLTNLSDTPTAELVQAVLERVAAKAREHDEVNAEKLRLDVELENAVRGAESRTRGLKATVDKGLKEVADVRERLKEEENARSQLESDLQKLRSSSTTSSDELQALRSRITSLESSNRDTLGLLESKSTAHDRLAEELSAQHLKIVGLRREISTLEQSVQAASSASTSSKFREQSLQQEVELLKRNNEWFETELKTKSSEYLKYRKEKGSRIAELQRLNEDSNSNIEALKRTESNLRNRLEELGQKADDSLLKIQQMQEATARSEEVFQANLATANRLAKLQENGAKSARDRAQDLQLALEQAKEDAADQLGRGSAELDSERSGKEAAERRVMELESQVERLEADVATLNDQASLPGTPRRGVNGSTVDTTTRAGSVNGASTPASSRMKSGLSFTQLYAEYSTAKSELDTERRRNEKLSTTMDEMIHDLESKQPEMEELQADHERLQAEAIEMSSLLDNVGKERDRALKESRKWEGQVGGLTREGEVLRQQLRDLSAQVKTLLLEVHARDEGLNELSTAEQLELQRVARGEVNEDEVDGMTDTGRFISQHLTVFKNVRELQEQNAKLLRVTRELGEQMEGEEARAKQNQQAQEREELESLRSRVERYKDELKSMVTQSQSYVKERDMFRRMLSHRGQLPAGSDLESMFGQSVNGQSVPGTPTHGGLGPNPATSPSSKDMADYAKLLKDMQTHFDSYRQEAATDHSALKRQLDSLSKKNSELHGENARAGSQLTLAHERYEMLQANYNMLKTENGGLQKRSQSLAESAAKQDLRTQQVAEELVEVKGTVDRMRNENANLKAKDELSKNIEKRLSEDNEALRNERSRLNNLNSDLQSLQNERERAESETRRSLQNRAESLESELQNTKRKLGDEVEDGKKAALRREFEHQQNQKRIDDLVASLGSVREELIAAKTTRDHLQARVDELAIELRSAEERVQVLQPRPPPRGNDPPSTSSRGHDQVEEDISREQELAIEVSELKRDLELSRGELENAQVQVEQYKQISQQSEERLQNFTETQEQYREEMDRIDEEKNAKIRELEQRVSDISTELTQSNNELSIIRSEQAEKTRQFEEQKSGLDTEITRLKDEDERHATAAHFHQEDLKAQAEIAQQAQQNYENELLKHAEAAKALQKVRTDYNQLRMEVVGLKTETEAARASLSQNEENWTESKERYERELTELRSRREDVNNQNKLLHQQLENVSSQITALQQNRAPSASDEDVQGSPATGLENLQEVIKYLRREKEIVDVQYELSIQDSKRMKQQLDYAQSQLDEARLKLDQERRAQADKESNFMSHNKLMETINELNLFRESSVTLRNEARLAQTQLAEKSRHVEELFEQIQPLQTKSRELENEKETQLGEMRLLQEDRDRWQQRTQSILQKYDRVDPAEMEALKEQLTSLQSERDALVVEKQPMKDQIDSIPEQINAIKEEMTRGFEDRRQRIIDQFKGKARELNGKITALVREKEEVEKQASATRQELETVQVERDSALAKALSSQSQQQPQGEHTQLQNGVEEGQVEEDPTGGYSVTDKEAIEEKLAAAEARANSEASKSNNLQGEINSYQSRIEELEGQIVSQFVRLSRSILKIMQNELQQTVASTNHQLSQVQTEQPPSDEMQESGPDRLEKLRQELLEARQEAEQLKANISITASIANQPNENGSKSVLEQVNERVEAIQVELNAQHTERLKQLEAQFQQRSDTMKNTFNKKLIEGRNQRERMDAEHKAALESMTKSHQEEVAALEATHQETLERVKGEEEARLQQSREAWLTEHPAPEVEASATVKGEPSATGSLEDWNPTETEVKAFIDKNVTAKNIVVRNITSKVNSQKEAIVVKTREEMAKIHEEDLAKANEEQTRLLEDRLAAARKTFDSDLDMATKKANAKGSMAENRARTMQAKLSVVENAAKETPEKQVVGVWELARVAKALPPPPPVTAKPTTTTAPGSTALATSVPQQATQQQSQVATTVQPATSQTSAPSSVVSHHPAQGQNPFQPASSGQLASTPQVQPSGQSDLPPQQQNQVQQPQPPGNFGRPTPPQSLPRPPSAPGQQQRPGQISTGPLGQGRPPQQSPATSSPGAASLQEPRGPAQQQNQQRQNPQGQAHPNMTGSPRAAQGNQQIQGTGPAAIRSLIQSSGIPTRGGTNRGRGVAQAQVSQAQSHQQGSRGGLTPNNQRGGGGRGRGNVGRGGGGNPQQIQTTGLPQNQPQPQGSPGSGGNSTLNVNARQFVPGGNKRPREDGAEGTDNGSGGKRPRGGGPSS
ncbi:MAG: hypothetical protein M1812_001339 [Candelaria pacifica]|nr:MAG: hypothetical protein M1812_001339 [Candelaria pacifica]